VQTERHLVTDGAVRRGAVVWLFKAIRPCVHGPMSDFA